MSAPVFLSLSDWGGTPNGWPAMTIPATHLYVHHSVTNETGDPVADFQVLDSIGRSRGHGGISYSFAIHPTGTIGEGQGTRRGAHTAGNGCNGSPWGWNPCSFGVCFIGNFDPATGGDELTPAAIDAFRWLRDRLIADGVLVPGVYPTGGHRDAPGNATGCPGDNIAAALDILRAPYTEPAPPPIRETDTMRLFRDVDADTWAFWSGINWAENIHPAFRDELIRAGVPHGDISGAELTNIRKVVGHHVELLVQRIAAAVKV